MAVTDKWLQDLTASLGGASDEGLNAQYAFTQQGDQGPQREGLTGTDISGSSTNSRARAAIDQERSRRKQVQEQKAEQERQRARELQGRRDQATSVAADSARRNLVGSMADVKTGANQRGLLYSGLRAGAEADTGANAAAGLAQQRAAINQATEAQMNETDMGKISGGMNRWGMEANKNQADYKEALDRKRNKEGVGAAIGGGLGGILPF